MDYKHKLLTTSILCVAATISLNELEAYDFNSEPSITSGSELAVLGVRRRQVRRAEVYNEPYNDPYIENENLNPEEQNQIIEHQEQMEDDIREDRPAGGFIRPMRP